MSFKKRKTRLERIEQKIQDCAEQLRKEPDNKLLQEQLRELENAQVSAMLKSIDILNEFIRNEQENNNYNQQEEL